MHQANTHQTAPRISRVAILMSHAPRYAPSHPCSPTEATDKTRHSHDRVCATNRDNRHTAFSTNPAQAVARLTRCRAELREIEMHRSEHTDPLQYPPMPQTTAHSDLLARFQARQYNRRQTTSALLSATAAPSPPAHQDRPIPHPQQSRDRIGWRPTPPHAQLDMTYLGTSKGSVQF